MADATLNDVILKLRADNDKQLKEQHSTTNAITSLSSTIRALLEKMEGDALKNREALLEARKKDNQDKKDKATSKANDSKSLAVFGNPFKGLFSSMGSLVAFAGAFALATEGFGPSIKDLNKLTGNVAKFTASMNRLFLLPARLIKDLAVPPGKSIYNNVFKNIKLIDDAIEKRYNPFVRRVTPDDIAKGLKTKSGDLAKLGQFTKLEDPRESSLTQKQKPQSPLVRFFNNLKSMIKSVTPTKTIQSAIEKLAPVFEAIKNNRVLLNIVRFVKPLAAILSVFDGIKTARKEMEDEQGIVDKIFAGTGGLIGGTVGAFFGEFANMLKNIPIFIIKKMLPEDYLITDENGNVTINKDKNLFTKILGGIETLDFNQLLKDIIQIPFEALGSAFTSITTGLGWTGTEEEQKKSKESWSKWWNNFKTLNGFGQNVSSMFDVAFELIYSPINAILEALLKNFTKDGEDREKTTLMQKIKTFTKFLFNLIPSKQDIIDMLPSGLAKTLGYQQTGQKLIDLNKSDNDIKKIVEDIQKLQDTRIGDLQRSDAFGNKYHTNRYDNTMSQLLENLSDARKDRDAVLSGGTVISSDVINNNNNAIGDTLYMANPGATLPESLRFQR